MRFLAVFLLMLTTLGARADDAPAYIAVTANAWVEAVPDMLSLSLSLRATGRDVSALQQSVDKTTQQIVKAARELDLKLEDIDSSQLSIMPEYEWRDNQRLYRGQTVQREVSLTLRDVERYGALVESLSRFDIDQMSPPRPAHSDFDQLKLSAITKALERATVKAQHVARTLGVKLGEVLRVEELGSGQVMPAGRMLAMEASSAPEVHFGQQRINASVALRYGIKN
jgi:hypothetical protein